MKSNDSEKKGDKAEPEQIADKSEVGYRRPPKSTRFQPGQSGNPKGRPKGSLNIQTVTMATLLKKVTINEGGKRRQVTKFEAAVLQVSNQAASGNGRAFDRMMELVRQTQATQSADGEVQLPLKVEDTKIMVRIVERFRQQSKVENIRETEKEDA